MLIHCSKKLAAKLPETSKSPVPDNSRLGAWHGHMFVVDRRQCVVFCHDQTRFALFMGGWTKPDFKALDFWFADLFANTMMRLDYPQHVIEKGLSLLGPPRLDTATNRSVQGAINQLVMSIKSYSEEVPDVLDLPMYSLSAELCRRPTTVRVMKGTQWLWPEKDMLKFIEQAELKPNLSVVH